jgi:multisubunit Na+/H+ antiporter MnhE subunit
VPSFASSRIVKAIKDSAFEYLFLVGLWMLFVSMTKGRELLAGLIAALLAAVADGIIKSIDYAKFKPRLEWLPLIFWEAWYALDGTWAIMMALFKHIAGKESEAEFVSVPLTAGSDDAESWARRALMVAYLTIPPNFIVLGIDREQQRMLVHQVSPTAVPLIAKKLGAKEEGKVEVRQR